MVKYWEILKENTKHNLMIPTAISFLLLCLSPFVLGVDNLPLDQTAKVLEMYVAFLGIILLTPVFLPEQNQDIRDLIRSKYTNIKIIYGLRIIQSVIVLSIFLAVYMCILQMNSCEMKFFPFFAGTFAEMLFMGGAGILSYALFDHVVIGYMIPIFYYAAAMSSGTKYLKIFYPFSMSLGSYKEKFWLFAGAVLMAACGILIRGRK